MISKQLFVEVIDGLRRQNEKDVVSAEMISDMFSCHSGLYDNGILFASVIRLLQEWFPKQGDFCEIEHWVFERDYGKRWDENGEVDRETADEFYDRLIGTTQF
jgi:hypothetical protein